MSADTSNRTTIDVTSLGRNSEDVGADGVLTKGSGGYAEWAAPSGGGGSLPDWWTVDSTEDAETVTFAGTVTIAPSNPNPGALIIPQSDTGNDTYIDCGGASFVVGAWDETHNFVAICQDPSDPLGFFGATAVTKRTGVAVTAAGIHAALVSYGLIAA